ncbi:MULTISPECIES: hypothetical protein [Vagococcus]|uniref:Uncharacterized protein n=1 Tax=Vagococcus fluvialis bH819 TaxID=1255619 RepID=A0A1X6WKD4_9ENTE|nr:MULTISPECIES: hypothetical protein [Vagococcus]SLM84700.1 hypothetical protein FM121_01310 [Vagococcus fluvialis bH819]
MKKKIIIASLISVVGLFLIAGTITLASTTSTAKKETSTSSQMEDNQSYCQRENHKMSDGNFYCDDQNKGYHNENCDYYEEAQAKNSDTSQNKNCHNYNNMGNKRHGTGHMKHNNN